MGVKLKRNVLVATLLLTLTVVTSSAVASDSIVIEVIEGHGTRIGDDFIFPSDRMWGLTCKSSTSPPVEWIRPTLPKEFKDRDHSHELESRLQLSSTAEEISIIVLETTNHRDTGYYTCRLEDGTTKSVYVYIWDQANLMVKSKLDSIVPILVNHNQLSSLACRPTHPKQVNLSLGYCYPCSYANIIVEECASNRLYQNFRQIEPCDTGSKLVSLPNSSWTFDPHRGFSVNWTLVQLPNKEETIYCFATSDSKKGVMKFTIFLPEVITFRTPKIEGKNSRYVAVGETIKLNCSVENFANSALNLKWTWPNHEGDRVQMSKPVTNDRLCNKAKCKSTVRNLQVVNATLNDTGVYRCIAEDDGRSEGVSFHVTVHDGPMQYANISANRTEFGASIDQSVVFLVDVEALIEPELVWYSPEKKPLSNGTKFIISNNKDMAWLQINDINRKDFGVYTLNSTVKNQTQTIKFNLKMEDKPAVKVKPIATKDGAFSFNCVITANPPVNAVSLHFRPCTSGCSNETETLNHDIKVDSEDTTPAPSSFTKLPKSWVNEVEYSLSRRFQSLTVNVKGLRQVPGEYFCLASNLLGRDAHEESYTVDFQGKPVVKVKWIPTTDDAFSFSCNITANPPADQISLQFRRCSPSSSECSDDAQQINTHDILASLNNETLTSDFVKLPADWVNEVEYSVNQQNQSLIVVVRGLRQSSGKYFCQASNSMGSSDEEVIMNEVHGANWGIVIVIVLFVIVLVALLTVLFVKIRKERKRKEIFRLHQLDVFRKGDPGSINPDLPVDEQTELLPYDRKWEFPRERLKLGVQLGAGAFGRVLKGEAIRIGAEPVTTVAVKMVRAQGNIMALKALMSELKIMIHLGSHLNVVNLLGACTKRVTRGELLVIVEYCRYGNVQNYLIRHRDRFINQVDGDGQFNANLTPERLSSAAINPKSQYAVLRTNSDQVDYRAGAVSFQGTTDGTSINTGNMRSDMSEMDSSGVFVTSSSGQTSAGWRTNYRGDYRDQPTQPITTKDLICWAFQIARGMSYLAKRKVLHGDLAARNVLLADDNIVKVADFGLAREVYRSENYKKKGEGPLPVKWMAVESIGDRIFSTQSDVWSFGVVMWELFSLGKTPYPGLEADENFFRKLTDGYRMEQPRYAPNAIYNLMMDCWNSSPSERPNFSQLEESLGVHLEDSVRQFYIDLNQSYIQANCPTASSDATDYLAMMADVGIDHQKLQHCQYVNMPVTVDVNDDGDANVHPPDYLRMDSTADKVEDLDISGYLCMGTTSFNAPQTASSAGTERSTDSGCPYAPPEANSDDFFVLQEDTAHQTEIA